MSDTRYFEFENVDTEPIASNEATNAVVPRSESNAPESTNKPSCSWGAVSMGLAIITLLVVCVILLLEVRRMQKLSKVVPVESDSPSTDSPDVDTFDGEKELSQSLMIRDALGIRVPPSEDALMSLVMEKN